MSRISGERCASVRHLVGNLDRLDAHRADALEQVNDVLFVVCEAVGVELLKDGCVLRFLLFVLVENPFERGAVAEFVITCGGDAYS